MTREQAKREIDSLDFYLQNHTDDYGEESHTAMMMAIKALEQQTCEDAISRQAVLDIFADNADAVRPYSKTWEEVKALPSVNPQPKTGHWIQTQEKDDAEPFILWECSCCHKEFRGVVHKVSNYCPSCGCRMVEPQKSEKINCKATKCENCQNHNYCDYEPQERSDEK